MQTLDVISVNFWQILVSICNLLLLLWIVKRFLYGPVKATLQKRQGTVDALYADAEQAKAQAQDSKTAYEEKLSGAEEEASLLLQNAVSTAKARENEILSEAKKKADGIIRQAESEAQLEMKKAQASIKEEIVEVSTKLSEKLLQREVKAKDHKELIDSFLDKIGEDNG